MKVTIENLTTACKVGGNLDLDSIGRALGEGAVQRFGSGLRFRPSPDSEIYVFMLGDGNVKIFGPSSMDASSKVLKSLLSMPEMTPFSLKVMEPLRIQEVIASADMGRKLDPKKVYEEFKAEGIVVDPSELPGFILRIGNSNVEVLIFPEGKLVSRGADNIMDAVSTLKLVESRLGPGMGHAV